jgi:hypothetical protein
MNLFRWLLARVYIHVTITPVPTQRPLALLLGPTAPCGEDTVRHVVQYLGSDDVRHVVHHQEEQPELLARHVVQKKPARKRARKPKAPVMLAAADPEPPTEDAWLTNLRKRKHHPITDNGAERLPPNTSSAVIRGTLVHREAGETLHDFYARIKGIGGDGLIDWIEEPTDKTRLSIIQDHLNRPLKANTDEYGWDQILPEDLVGMQGAHGTVH